MTYYFFYIDNTQNKHYLCKKSNKYTIIVDRASGFYPGDLLLLNDILAKKASFLVIFVLLLRKKI